MITITIFLDKMVFWLTKFLGLLFQTLSIIQLGYNQSVSCLQVPPVQYFLNAIFLLLSSEVISYCLLIFSNMPCCHMDVKVLNYYFNLYLRKAHCQNIYQASLNWYHKVILICIWNDHSKEISILSEMGQTSSKANLSWIQEMAL